MLVVPSRSVHLRRHFPSLLSYPPFLYHVLLFPPFFCIMFSYFLLFYIIFSGLRSRWTMWRSCRYSTWNWIIWKVIDTTIDKMWTYPLADLADKEDTVRLSEIKILINDPFEEFPSGEVFHYKDHLVWCEVPYVWMVFNQYRVSIINRNKNRNDSLMNKMCN